MATHALDLAARRPPTLGSGRLICVDGPAGAGKTTLAGVLAARTGAPLVHMDDLYDGWPGLAAGCAQADAMLRSLAAGRAGHYRRYDWHLGRYAGTAVVEPAPLVVIEGVGSGARGHADLVTVLVWVEAGWDERLRRGLARDGAAAEQHWRRWEADQNDHFTADATRDRADLVLVTDASGVADPATPATFATASPTTTRMSPEATRRGDPVPDPVPHPVSEPVYDVARVRAHFPALTNGAAHFDGPGGTQTADVVARAIHDTLVAPLSNRGTVTVSERNADAAVHAARSALADLTGADPRGIVFGRSMTQLTFDLARTIAQDWGPGDEVVVSRLDHDANVRSWVIAAERAGATVRWADFDPQTGELDAAQYDDLLTERTRLVAVTAASNLIGTMPDVSAIARRVHDAGAWLYVDGVHYTPHAPVDVASLGADFYACSPYKFLGPHCGAVAARVELLEQLRPDKLLPSPDTVPERFELGSLPYELMAGTAAAIDFLADLAPGAAPAGAGRRDRILSSMAALETHETRLRTRIEEALSGLPGVTLLSRAHRRTPTLLAAFADRDPQEVRAFLAARGVNAPAGAFYAIEPSRRLGLGDAGALRIGLAPYTDDDDVTRLLDGLGECLGA